MDQPSTKPALLLIEPMMAEIEAALDARYDVPRLFGPAEAKRVASARGSVRAVVTGGSTGLPRPWFDRLPAPGLVAINGVGTGKVDLTAFLAGKRPPTSLTASDAEGALA